VRREEVLKVGHRLLDHLAAGTLDLSDAPMVTDGSCFTDPERFAKERQLLFRRTPQVMGWAGEVAAPGDFVARDVAGVPVLVTRDPDGELRAFLNACSHRGMPVGVGCGSARRFTCGYHGWSYDNGGQLVGIPSRDQFAGCDVAGLGLRPLPVTISAGLIVVGLEPDVEVEGYLDELEEPLGGFHYDRYRTIEGVDPVDIRPRANWKLIVDVNVEGYHVPALHRDTIAGVVFNNGSVDTFGRHSRFCLPIIGFEQLADVPDDDWPERIPLVIVHTVFPSTVLIEHEQGGSMIRISPGERPNESVVQFVEATHKPIDAAQIEMSKFTFQASVDVVLAEDFPGAELCQKGYDGGSPTLVAGTGEALIRHWHEVWDAAVA